MLSFPLLGEDIPGKWKLQFAAEFHMTNDSHLFKTESQKGYLPLYEGKMIWHFDHRFAEPKWWIPERDGRKALLGKELEKGQSLTYEFNRLAFRDITSSTNERSLIATVIPAKCFAGNTLVLSSTPIKGDLLFFIVALFNSFVIDWMIRRKITSHCNMFYMYQLPIPRLTEKDTTFWSIVKRAARLICTAPEFDDLAKEVGMKNHNEGATDPAERGKLRAELDGLIAHLYSLTEDEFAHILSTFPIVPEATKQAAMEAFKAFAPKTADAQLMADIMVGESQGLEFKSSARWDFKENRINKVLEQAIIKTCAAFLNTDGGTLLIGVDDNGNIVGIEADYKTLGKKQNRDAFENWLVTILLEEYAKDIAPLIHISFCKSEDKEVCRVTSKPSPKPVYGKEGNFYIRAGNSSRQLTAKEAVDYCKHHWQA